ncbi:hypothetical protein QOZ80_7AG0568910 [Eleusine coracana subsp. coracana]|nr:hypothetical protein QOZ80_7AG0568910 [Eleusine coracana subsp. coracana]
MWADVMATIRFQPADLERAKKATMSTLNHIFRDYKSKLNCQYIKKNQTHFDKHGNISQQEWDEFVEQKMSSASKELCEKMVELNKYKPRLGEIIMKDPTTVEVVQALKGPITTQTEAGMFTPEYHKNELAKAIGTKEHGGRAAMDVFLRGSSTFMQPSVSTQPSVSGQPSVLMESETENITKDTPCELHVPFGYKGKTMKVASGTAFPGEMLHNRDIPPGYVCVTVSEIVPGYEDNEIEYPIPEAGFDKEPKDPKTKSDVDEYLAALKKRLVSTGKLVLQEEDPRNVLSYDDQILENPVDDVDYPKFILGKPLISNNMYKNLPWEMQKLHDWYMMTSKEGVTEITCSIPKEVFNEDDEQILYLFWEDVHSMFRLDQMDVTFITLWCIMNFFFQRKETNRKDWRVAYVNPSRINQSSINPMVNLKNYPDKTPTELAEIKTVLTTEARTYVANYLYDCFMRWQDRECIMAPYNFK